jgi:hypothetical protein
MVGGYGRGHTTVSERDDSTYTGGGRTDDR